MPRPSRALALAAIFSLGAAVALAQQATVKPVASVKQIMLTMTIPFSETVFSAASEPPKTDKEWAALQDTALALAESGNLLMIGPRARDKAEWMKMARALVDASEAVMKAASARNADLLSDKSDALYETCDGCHNRYMDKSAPPAK